MLEWEWYRNNNTKVLFLHMLLKVNWKDGKFEGKVIPRGSFVSSYPRLSQECNMTINEIRTALKHLETTGEITVKSHTKYSVFTVNNYCLYQDMHSQTTDNQQSDHRLLTDKSHAINSQLTTIEERKEEKESKKVNKYTCAFETLWSVYPRKKEKSKAYGCYKARLADGFSEDELITAVKRYADECKRERTDDRYIKLGATFLGPNTPFMDYLERGGIDDAGKETTGNAGGIVEQAVRAGVQFDGF